MGNLLVIGAGGHGRVVADAASRMGTWERIAFLDDRFPETTHTSGFEIIGKIDSLPNHNENFPTAIVGIGNSERRMMFIDLLGRQGFNIGVVVHPSAVVAKDVFIGAGTVIFAGVVINTGAKIGAGCIINTSASVDHDCILADGVHICPGARLAGEVSVGTGSWIGIGSSVIQQVVIGDHVVVGAGAAVINNVPEGSTVAGVPAKRIQASKRKSDQDE